MTEEIIMKAADYNKRELEQGRLTWEQLAVLCDYTNVDQLKRDVRTNALGTGWDAITERIQVFQRKRGLSADGMAGADTRLRIRLPVSPPSTAQETLEMVEVAPAKWAPFDGPAVRQPRNRAEVLAMFGDPGELVENKAWSKKNLIDCHEKNGNRLPGVPAKWWVTVHRVVHPYLHEALRRVQLAAPDFVVEVIGSHNWRPIRGKAGNPLSMHSWAIAVDLNAKVNRGVDVAKGKAPQAFTPEWDKLFPPDPRRITRPVIDAFASCGFAWGADWDEDGLTSDETWLDTMHFEWIARSGSSILV